MPAAEAPRGVMYVTFHQLTWDFAGFLPHCTVCRGIGLGLRLYAAFRDIHDPFPDVALC
jgi:hypothetical protein